MTRLCERPACSEPGAIAYGFDADRLLVWLIPIDPSADRNRAGVLCLRHADAMVVPIGWSLDDARDPTPRLFRSPRPARRVPARKGSPRKPRSARTPDGVPATAAEPEVQLSLEEAEPPSAASRATAPAAAGRPPTSDDEQPVPDPERTVAEVTGLAAASVDDPDATVAIPWKPDFDETDDLGGVLDATSPLLSRAFTGQRTGRRSTGRGRPR
ncbi:hypothetical protein [Desertimonas flava]|uniref:hypothetical protein n=1 Tax=Desertimonas flava TaxID=2064846 RepID=UPI000E35206D|nr:hypothetical protein [Desertimonas flava]